MIGKVVTALVVLVTFAGGVWVLLPEKQEDVPQASPSPAALPERAAVPDVQRDESAVAGVPVDTATMPTHEEAVVEEKPAPAVAANIDIPDLELETYTGESVRLRELAGTPLIINSWAAWCPFCVKELPDLAAIQRELGDTVRVIAINRAESLSTAKKFSDEKEAGNLLLLLDPSDSFYTSIGAFTMPETLFINADGSLNFHKRGVMAINEIRERAADLR